MAGTPHMLQIIDILKYDSESGTTAVYLKKNLSIHLEENTRVRSGIILRIYFSIVLSAL